MTESEKLRRSFKWKALRFVWLTFGQWSRWAARKMITLSSTAWTNEKQ